MGQGASIATSADPLAYRATTAQVFSEAGYKVNVGRASFEPFIGLAYVHLRSDAYQESGGAAALIGRKMSDDMVYGTIGLRAATDFIVSDRTKVTARGMVGWRHAFDDVTPSVIHTLAGSDPFSISGVPGARNALALEAGLDFAVTQNATLAVSYSGQIGNNFQDHGVRADFKAQF